MKRSKEKIMLLPSVYLRKVETFPRKSLMMTMLITSSIESKSKRFKRKRSNDYHNNVFRMPKINGRTGMLPPIEGH
jgi:hypothetical protein